MSFIVDSFDDPLKWNELIIGTGQIQNRTTDAFQVVVNTGGDTSGLVSAYSINIIDQDLRVKVDRIPRESRIKLNPASGGGDYHYSYTIARDELYNQIFVTVAGGVVASIIDPVPRDVPAELRITARSDYAYPNGLISFYYEGVLLYEEGIRRADQVQPYVYIEAVGTAANSGTATFYSTGYVPPPPPTYNLSINSNPEGIPFTIKEAGMSEIIVDDATPWSGTIQETTKKVEVPSNVIKDGFTHNFEQWEDGSTNPIRIISLTSDLSLFATYKLQLVTALEVHAFVDSVEVVADGLIVETGYAFQTPVTIEVDPGTYTIRLTYLGVTKDYTRTLMEEETIRVDGQMVPPEQKIPLWIILVALTGIWLATRKRK